MEESREKGGGVRGRTDRHRDGERRRPRKEGASERSEGRQMDLGKTQKRKERKKEKREGEGRHKHKISKGQRT